MKGRILDFTIQSNSGQITGNDDKRYQFQGGEWKGSGTPTRGMTVDFEIDGNQATGVYPAVAVTGAGTKSKVAAGLFAIFLGGWGIHKFYLGFTGPGLVFLLINTVGLTITWLFLFIPNFVLGLMALIEGIIYLTKSDDEFEQIYVVGRKRWF